MTRKRFTKEDWLRFGLEQLAAQGPDALKLAALCEAAGRTTGSFYYHFSDQASFLSEMLAHWQKVHTQDVITEMQGAKDARAHAEKLSATVMALDQSIEVGVRTLAQQLPLAADRLAQVDRQRLEHLSVLYHRSTGLSEAEAEALAELEYAAFVGAQMLWKNSMGTRKRDLAALLQRLVSAHLKQTGEPRK